MRRIYRKVISFFWSAFKRENIDIYKLIEDNIEVFKRLGKK